MRPIEIRVTGRTTRSSAEICEEFLDLDRWPAFQGYLLIPGIVSAHFEKQTPAVVGSKIRVHNKDGSSHVEEIIEWDTTSRVAFRFQEFGKPLRFMASHFIETWTFSASAGGTQVIRQMAMYPTGILGRTLLLPISKMMKKAFEENRLHELHE